MPSATILRTITQQETAEALRQQFGSRARGIEVVKLGERDLLPRLRAPAA